MDVNVIILAGGKGSRIKMDCPKILMNVAGKPLIDYVLSAVQQIKPSSIKVVVPENKQIIEYMENQNISYIIQDTPKGTAHALLTGLKGFSDDDIIVVLNGDVPLINSSTLEYFINNYYDASKIAFISTELEDPEQYGRIVRDEQKNFIKIIEDKDIVSDDVKKIKEVNTGIYMGKAKEFFKRLACIKNYNNQKEYYLTDCLRSGDLVYLKKNSNEFLGVNTLADCAKVAKIIWLERAKQLMNQGICIVDPQNVYIDENVQIEPDVTIYPNVTINRKTFIKRYTNIYSGCRIVDSFIGERCTILDNTLIVSSEVGNNCAIGPMAHLRPTTILKGENRIGNFVETKKVLLGKKTKASHLTYLGDATIGENVNIGCGTITCNYDGVNKNVTIIGDNAFIGSDVQFVAPVKIGCNVVIAAGSTITEDVPDNALAIARAKQINKPNWFVKWYERLRKQ